MSEAKVEKIKVYFVYTISHNSLNPFSWHLGSCSQDYRASRCYDIIELKFNSFQGSSFATGIEVQSKRRRVLTISTGSKSVDTILGGKFRHHTSNVCLLTRY